MNQSTDLPTDRPTTTINTGRGLRPLRPSAGQHRAAPPRVGRGQDLGPARGAAGGSGGLQRGAPLAEARRRPHACKIWAGVGGAKGGGVGQDLPGRVER